MPSTQGSDVTQMVRELLSEVGEMQRALEMIGKGRAYYGAEERDLDAEAMRVIALRALGLKQ